MPRPNRYHPYARGNQVASPRFATASSAPRHSTTLPIMAEQPLARPFQCIFPGYIRATTSDGKALIAKSVFQAPDGILHVQMQVVRFPSEDVKLFGATPLLPFMPSHSVRHQQVQINPELTGMGLSTEQVLRKGSGSVSSQDGRSVRSMSEECAIVTDDEDLDAEGDIDDAVDNVQWQTMMEQSGIMAGLVATNDEWGALQ